jgi:hypothetical protein
VGQVMPLVSTAGSPACGGFGRQNMHMDMYGTWCGYPAFKLIVCWDTVSNPMPFAVSSTQSFQADLIGHVVNGQASVQV